MSLSLPSKTDKLTRYQSIKYDRDHTGDGFGQWETTLQCNGVAHWPSQCPEWSLYGYGCIVLCFLCHVICPWPLHWRHNDHDGVSNHQPHGCLLNRLFRRRSKITSKLCVTGFCVGNSPGPVNSPHKGPVTRKMFPFDDVIMMDSGFCFMHSPLLVRRAFARTVAIFCFPRSELRQ